MSELVPIACGHREFALDIAYGRIGPGDFIFWHCWPLLKPRRSVDYLLFLQVLSGV